MQQSFINGFTHELKTPIASLKIFIDTFKKHEITRQKQLEYLELMGRDTERLQSNVMQILNMAKIEDKSFRPNLVKTDLKTYVEKFLDKNSYLFHHVNFSTSLSKDSFILADQDLLDIILMNTINNATSYNSNKIKEVQITIEPAGNYHSLVVTDNGQGIEKEHLNNIFKKFYQVGKSAKGSGIGLYMVWQIMKLHKAKVFAKSEGISTGSSFYFNFKAWRG